MGPVSRPFVFSAIGIPVMSLFEETMSSCVSQKVIPFFAFTR